MIDDLTAADATAAAALSTGFGWPHRRADWDFFLRIGHGIAWREAGVLCGTAMWFPLDESHASIGLVQVAPDMQGRGIGRKLMRAVMERAAPRALKLHATMEGAALYASLGFVAGDEVEQWQGAYRGDAGLEASIRAGVISDRAAILHLDQSATGLSRCAILDECMRDAPIHIIDEGGFGVRRNFGRGALIGPVIAASETMAIALVRSLAEPGFLRIDVPSARREMIAWLAAQGLRSMENVRVMTVGAWPETPRIHALASQALG